MSNEMDKVSADRAGKEVEIPKNKKWEKEIVSAIADGEGGVIPLPKDFYYAGGSISTGIVISDVENDDLNNSQKGNQFVWIPATTEAYENAAKYSAKEGGKNWPQYCYHTSDNGQTEAKYQAKIGWANPEEQMNSAKTSIEKYEGFYVARYEAGVPSNATDFYVSSDTSEKNYYKNEKKNINTYKPVSKKENQAWNYISQKNAEIVSKNMYEESSSVNSFLIDSNAWNYICGDIFETILKKQGKNLTTSKTYGNYYNNDTTDYGKITCLYAIHDKSQHASSYIYGTIPENVVPKDKGEKQIELSTGSSDDFKIYNIYDMAGNMWEWTAETATQKAETNGETEDHTYGVIRGGGFNWNGKAAIVHSDGLNNIETAGFNFGFRTVLYMK